VKSIWWLTPYVRHWLCVWLHVLYITSYSIEISAFVFTVLCKYTIQLFDNATGWWSAIYSNCRLQPPWKWRSEEQEIGAYELFGGTWCLKTLMPVYPIARVTSSHVDREILKAHDFHIFLDFLITAKKTPEEYSISEKPQLVLSDFHIILHS